MKEMSCCQFVALFVLYLYVSGVRCSELLKVGLDAPATQDICGANELSGESGYLSSPNFPQRYANNLDCSKTISPPTGKRVEISFLAVEIENDDQCFYDQLTLTVGDEKYSGADFCGNHVPRNFTTAENVTIRLQTDGSLNYRGFQIYWEIVDDCDQNSFRCWDGSCIASIQKCDGNTDCSDQSDEIECVHVPSSYGECGKNAVPAGFTWDAKIVGGSQARQNSYPWIVPLFASLNQTHVYFFCSATIISERWLLTAAHCTETQAHSDLFGFLGTNEKWDFSSYRTYFDQVIVHPNYTEFFNLDISLLHTTQPIVFNDQISPICIPNQHDVLRVGEICVAIGWGDLYFNGRNGPDLLHQVRLPVLDNSVCGTSYPYALDAHICTGDFDKGGLATCQGDSGGPLVCFKDGSWVQFGVTSYGYGCGFPENPDIFTDVRSYHTWIQETLSADPSTSSAIDICGDSEILEHSGDLITPNYPGNYDNNLDCSKTLSPPYGEQFTISFLTFKLGNLENSFGDNLTVTIGNKTVGTFSGNTIPSTITTDKNVTMRFRSDYTSVQQGFRVHWEVYTDIDECASEIHDCSVDATCENTYGSFICRCLPGFRGDGKLCTDIDECEEGIHICHDDAYCINTSPAGSFACVCKNGYTGDGVSCTDVDECATENGGCGSTNTTSCINLPGTFICDCLHGFTGFPPDCADPSNAATILNSGSSSTTHLHNYIYYFLCFIYAFFL